MKLFYKKSLSDPIYYIQETIRTPKGSRSVQVKRIGKHSELLELTDDPLGYAQKVLEQMNAEQKENKKTAILEIDFDKKVEYSKTGQIESLSTALNIGYFYIQYYYNKLKLDEFFDTVTAKRKIKFDCNLINRFMTYARILNPASKLKTCTKVLPTYYEKPDIPHQTVLRFMDVLYENYDAYISHLFKYSKKIVPRKTEVCYYDCSNFYFEIECEDYDYVDEVTGEIIKGYRKYGPSKEHKPNPIVEIGLFMDAGGIPLSMCVHPGNKNEQQTAIPEEKKLSQLFNGKKFIYCADAGLGSEEIRTFNSMCERSFVVTQSIKKLADVYKQAVFENSGYKFLSDDQPISIDFLKEFEKKDKKNKEFYEGKAYKVFPADKVCKFDFYEEIKLKNGKTVKRKVQHKLKQYIFVTFSRKDFEYKRFIRNRQVERAKKLLEDAKDPDDIKKGPNDVRRFIKRHSSAPNNAPVTDSYFIDESIIAEEEKYDGYYAIATNLAVMDDKDVVDFEEVKHVLDIMSGRFLIEALFRMLKTLFDTRPIYMQTTEHIIAHFMICYTALLLFRIMEVKVNETSEVHCTSENILNTLRSLNVHYTDIYCTALYDRSKVLDALETATMLGLNNAYYRSLKLNKIIREMT